ncbi:hypothetical protein JCM5350_001605 [Sporobolomyces pararoseus]
MVITLGWVKDRVERGEPLMIPMNRGLSVNPAFEPSRIVSGSVKAARRDAPFCPPFLEARLYTSELSNDPFRRDDFAAAVKAIAAVVREKNEVVPIAVKRRCRQDTWERLMLDEVEKHFTKSGYVRAFVRKNLIDLAERVRNWEMLYHPEDLFKKAGLPIIRNEVPTNWLRVPCDAQIETSRSLGRISRRQAHRIGYQGNEAEEGGISF